MTQPEALRLADLLLSENAMDCLEHSDDAAAELRRLHEENEALRQALAQEQEPVARVDYDRNGNIAWLYGPVEPDGTLLYTAPPSIEAAVLEEREACAKMCEELANGNWTSASAKLFANAIRARSEK